MEAEVPLFPLRSVLFPGGWLPLRVFEPRYLDMVQRCRAQGQAFGVVTLTEGEEVRQREGAGFRAEAFEAVGCFARIEQFEQAQPGLIHLRARGTQRFRLQSSRRLSHGLWVSRVVALPDDVPVTVPEDLRLAARQLQDLLAGWREHGASDEQLPMPQQDRQRLMEMDNPLLRLELVVDRLDDLSGSANP